MGQAAYADKTHEPWQTLTGPLLLTDPASLLTNLDLYRISRDRDWGSICRSIADRLVVLHHVVLQHNLTNSMSEVTSSTSELQFAQSAPLMGSNKGTGTPNKGPALRVRRQVNITGAWGLGKRPSGLSLPSARPTG